MNTAISLVERASVALGAAEHEKRLIELAKMSVGITAITNVAGYQECHAVRMSLKKARVEIEKTGKAARDDAVAFSKAVIAEERRLIGIIEPEETRLQAIQDAHDARVETERQAKAKAEAARVAAINARIELLLDAPANAIGLPSSRVKEMLNAATKTEITESAFGEFTARAKAVKDAAVAKLSAMHDSAIANEVEAARLKAEREEFARQKAEQEATAAAERARLAEEERAAKEKRDAEAAAERRRLDEEARIAREAREAADTKAKAERDTADKAAREQRAKEAAAQAEIDAKARAERAAEDRRIREAAAALEAREKATREEEARQKAERDRAARETLEREAEAERAAARTAALASAKRPTAAMALEQILFVAKNKDDYTDAEARVEIAVLAEANIPETRNADA